MQIRRLLFLFALLYHGAPGEIRTPGPLLRRQLLYPTELQAQNALVHSELSTENGRGERIRTSDILLPKQARYQAALRPENITITTKRKCK
jgi:hypothetical protein